MAKTVAIRNLILGEGLPKICVPIVGSNKEEIIKAAQAIVRCRPDMAEWRADYLQQVCEFAQTEEILGELREILGEIPLLFTFRTAAEGGEQEIAQESYIALYKKVMESGLVDAIDVELFLGDTLVTALTAYAHENNVKVIASNHDFVKTPTKEELVRRLSAMQKLGADVAKIAVMPSDKNDVLTLLTATNHDFVKTPTKEELVRRLSAMQKLGADVAKIAVMPSDKNDVLTLLTATHEAACADCGPVITMSMGGCGMVSRLLGEAFGSALTFAMAGRASAPGQIPIEELREILEIIHRHS